MICCPVGQMIDDPMKTRGGRCGAVIGASYIRSTEHPNNGTSDEMARQGVFLQKTFGLEHGHPSGGPGSVPAVSAKADATGRVPEAFGLEMAFLRT